MNMFFFICLPVVISAVVSQLLDVIWPKIPESTKEDSNRETSPRPMVKARADSAIVDRKESLAREVARKDERVELSSMREPVEPFQLPTDFDMAEFRSHRE